MWKRISKLLPKKKVQKEIEKIEEDIEEITKQENDLYEKEAALLDTDIKEQGLLKQGNITPEVYARKNDIRQNELKDISLHRQTLENQKSNMNRMLMNLKVTKTMSKTNETMEKTEKGLKASVPRELDAMDKHSERLEDISALFTRRYKDRNASLERELDALVNPRKESVPTNPVAQAPLEVSMSLEAPEHQLGKTDGKMNVIAAEQLALTEGDVGVLFESDRKSALTASAAWEALVLPNAPNHSLGESNHNVDAADHETANENRRAARDEAR